MRVPCVVAVRDVQPDDNNPLSAWQVVTLIKRRYRDEKHVTVMLVPDIESVNYGRGVGYEVNEHVPPAEVEGISATEIRRQIAAGETGWHELVDESIHVLLESMLA